MSDLTSAGNEQVRRPVEDPRTDSRDDDGVLDAIALVAMWLAESFLPQVLVVPNEAGKGASLLVLLFGGAVIVRRGRVIEAAALLVGGGAAWALREAHPLSLCQSDMLFRPCTNGEVAWMAIPAVGLLLAGSILLVSALPRWRPSR